MAIPNMRLLPLAGLLMISLNGCVDTQAAYTPQPQQAGSAQSFPTKWRVTCVGGPGANAVPIYWDVKKYNVASGKLDLVVTDRDGFKGDAEAQVIGNTINLYGESAKFDTKYNFTFKIDGCPGGWVGEAL
jgi:hypothetical protein